MIRRSLTYLTILAIMFLPVQLINASVEMTSMQISMKYQVQANNQCMQALSNQYQHAMPDSVEKSCCNDNSHDCHTCDHCPQAATAMILPFLDSNKKFSLKSEYYLSNDSLSGIKQKNLLRPPKPLI